MTSPALSSLNGAVHIVGEDIGRANSPESFEILQGVLVRSVLRRNSLAPAARSVMGRVGQAFKKVDLQEIADLLYLRSSQWLPVGRSSEKLRVADLFSGCGAMSLGVAEACRALGIEFLPAAPCDINEQALSVYARNFSVSPPPATDLDGVSSIVEGPSTPTELELLKRWSSLDMVVGGPPCQGHSNLNNHTRRRDPKNALYFKLARIAKLFSPKFLIIENVPAVVRDKGNVVPRTMRELARLGYAVEVGVVDLSKIGVPQSRKRHLLIAARGEFAARVPVIHRLVASYSRTQRSVGWALGDLLSVGELTMMDMPSSVTDLTKKRINFLFDNDVDDLPDSERPDCHRDKEHTYQAVYGRMSWDSPAPTITSGFNTMGQGRFVHPRRRRTITPHEAARLQFIPDFFSFDVVRHRNALTELIGNAVPPKLSYIVALELLR